MTSRTVPPSLRELAGTIPKQGIEPAGLGLGADDLDQLWEGGTVDLTGHPAEQVHARAAQGPGEGMGYNLCA